MDSESQQNPTWNGILQENIRVLENIKECNSGLPSVAEVEFRCAFPNRELAHKARAALAKLFSRDDGFHNIIMNRDETKTVYDCFLSRELEIGAVAISEVELEFARICTQNSGFGVSWGFTSNEIQIH